MELKFDVKGMTCAACSARVEKVTKEVPGVDTAEVNLLAGKMRVVCAKTVLRRSFRLSQMQGTALRYPERKRMTPILRMKAMEFFSVLFHLRSFFCF